ncbi:MAG: cation transporter [Dehalococcoidia bacterium]|nr:cation transporter [Dehalococcoidia bacterium]
MTTARRNAQAGVSRGILYALGLTITFMVVEVVTGLLTNSLALVADAGHMATDSGALLLTLGARWYSQRPAPAVRTWGYHRIEVLAALMNGALLVFLVAFIYWRAVARLESPPQVNSIPVLVVAVFGLGVNILAGFILSPQRKLSISAQGAFANVVADGLASVGVIIGGAVMLVTEWYQADAIASMVVGFLVLTTAWRLLRTATDILLETTPRHINLDRVYQTVRGTEGVHDSHDLHVWTLTTGFVAMSGHVVLSSGDQSLLAQHRLLMALRDRLKADFGIDHVTLQVEAYGLPGEEAYCEGEPVCLA